MVRISSDGDVITFEVIGWHKLWALKSTIEVHRDQIASVRHDPSAMEGWKGWRMPGTHVPKLITAGSYVSNGAWSFFDVVDRRNTVVVELVGHKYERLVVELENAAELAQQVTA